jgi:hypothetical protein
MTELYWEGLTKEEFTELIRVLPPASTSEQRYEYRKAGSNKEQVRQRLWDEHIKRHAIK